MEDGQLLRGGPLETEALEMLGPDDEHGNSRMLFTMQAWLLAERDARLARGGGAVTGKLLPVVAGSSPFFSSKHMSHYR
jgi:hypothetical protein